MAAPEETIEDQVREQVRERYARAARAAAEGNSACCGSPSDHAFGAARYADIAPGEVPEDALLASLGCGNPTAVAQLRPGERVLDLGCGVGTDVILSARRVGPEGKVYGLDFLDDMLVVARTNLDTAGVHNVELLKGLIEAIPLPPSAVDVAISNCVINLSVDKPAVFRELFRVLRPGGRLGLSDVIAEDHLTAADRANRGGYAECIAGALSFAEYRSVLADAGFINAHIHRTHSVADGLHGAIIQATKPTIKPLVAHTAKL